jgi:hypothetical protein
VSLTAQQTARLIAQVDCVSVELLDSSGSSLADEDLVPGDWAFVRPAPEAWDLSRWERERIRRPLQGCQVRVMDPARDVVLPVTATMKEARVKSFHYPRFALDDQLYLTQGDQWLVVHDRKATLSPPTGDGKFGEVRMAANGFALWVARGWGLGIDVSISRAVTPTYFMPSPSDATFVDYATLVSEDLKILCPSGALRIAAVSDQVHSDVITRRAAVTLHLTPGPNNVQFVIERAEID